MSEFDKLMKEGSKREDVKQRQVTRKGCRSTLLWTLGVSFIFTIVPPHLGVLVFLPTLLVAFIYDEHLKDKELARPEACRDS